VSSIINDQNAGDVAFDAAGNLWILTSSFTNFGLYKLPKPLPTSPTATINVTRIIAPTRATPTGMMIAGIAFNPAGLIFLSTKFDDRLYRLEADLTTTFIGTFNVADVGNDLTSCAFPLSVLPLKWLNYDVSKADNNRTHLDWEVNEQNSKGFFVQHSLNGTDWTNITYIDASGKGGESQRYSYTHYNPAPGKNYYRVKMIEEGNSESYTGVKMISFQAANENASLSIWPNPATDQIQLNLNGRDRAMKVRVYDMSGKLMMEKQLVGEESALTISSLKKGIYLINVSGSEGKSWNQKFIKQ
jgi:hypothetical protein